MTNLYLRRTGSQGPVVTATLVVAAVDSKNTARADYVCDGTADESEINTALNALPAEGGRVILLETPTSYKIASPIVINDDNIVLEGQGRSSKLFLVNGANDNVIEISDGATNVTGAVVRNLEIDGNKANNISGHGIFLNGAAFKATIYSSKVENCYIHDCEDCGIYGYLTEDSVVVGNVIDSNNECGVYFNDLLRPVVTGNNIHTNVDSNIKLSGVSGNTNATISNNTIRLGSAYSIEVDTVVEVAISNNLVSGGKGIYFNDTSANPVNATITGNVVVDTLAAASAAIYLDSCEDSTIVGNVVKDSLTGGIYGLYCFTSIFSGNVVKNPAGHGIELEGCTGASVVGNACQDAAANMSNIRINNNNYVLVANNNVHRGITSKYGVEVTAGSQYVSIMGNLLRFAGLTANIIDGGASTTIKDNVDVPTQQNIEIEEHVLYQDNKTIYMKNTSGGALAIGDIVIFKSVAAGNEITTTVAQGDDKVFGMAYEVIANNATGRIQTLGKTTALKVNGTAAIAIGDFIGTFTVAKIGMKAAAGDMVFAIALEAYAVADSNGVIDAIFIEPRKI